MPIISAQRIFPKNKGMTEQRYGNMYHFIFDLTKETPEKRMLLQICYVSKKIG